MGGGATDGQDVGPPLRNRLFCCSSRFNVVAPCSLVCATSSRHAHPIGTPARPAYSHTQRHHTCPECRNAVAPCSMACATPSSMPIQPQRHRAMPTGVRNAISQRSGWPNRRLQRTALRAREIRAFLKAESVQVHFRSIGAPPLKRNTFGGGG